MDTYLNNLAKDITPGIQTNPLPPEPDLHDSTSRHDTTRMTTEQYNQYFDEQE